MSEQSKSPSLDGDWMTFRSELTRASEIVFRLYERLDKARVTPAKTRNEIAALFDESLPFEPQPMEGILSEVENKIFANSTLYLSPRFFRIHQFAGTVRLHSSQIQKFLFLTETRCSRMHRPRLR